MTGSDWLMVVVAAWVLACLTIAGLLAWDIAQARPIRNLKVRQDKEVQ
jgi:cell division septal protein FtsQ